MRKIFSVNNNSKATDTALLIARIGIAGLMLTHGIPKLMMLLSGGPVQFPRVMGMSAEVSLGLTIFSEVLCSLLILVGFGTRIAVVPLIITMLVAVFLIHATDPMSKKEPGLQYLLVYLVLLFGGSGKYSIDYLLGGEKAKSSNQREEKDPTLAIYQ